MRHRIANADAFCVGRPRVVALACGTAAMLLGLVIIVSWHAHLESLLVLNPDSPAMQYNTAVGFTLSGLALVLAVLGWGVASRVLAFVVIVGSTTIFLQDVLHRDFGVDRLLFDPYIVTATMVPGRMAPHTAIAFVCVCIAIAVRSRKTWNRYSSIVTSLGSISIAVGLVAIVGYISGFEQAYGWGRFTRMAVLTAAGFVVLGTGLIAYSWRDARVSKRDVPQPLAIPVTIGAIAASIIVSQALLAYEDNQIELRTHSHASTFQHEIETEIESHVAMIERIAKRWENHGRPEQDRWQSEVALNFESFPGLRTIAWVDPEFRTQWVVPDDESVVGVRGNLRSLLVAAQSERQTMVSEPLELGRGELEIIITRPTFIGGSVRGYIVGVCHVEEILANMLDDQLLPATSIAVFADDRQLYERVSDGGSRNQQWAVEVPATVRDQEWTVRVWPGNVALQRTLMPYGALVVGVVLAGLLGLVTWLAQNAALRSRALEQANTMLQREVIERTQAQKELQRSSAALEQSNRSLQEFAYVASHDLKAPLVSLESLATMLRDDTRDILDGEAALYLDRIVVNAGKMRQLLDDLLELSRVGRVETSVTSVHVGEVVAGVISQLSQNLQDRRAEVIVDGGLPVVLANSVRLHQVFANLIDNAVTYTPPDRTSRIVISAAEGDEMWQITVADNGTGIPQEYQEKVFTMFQRLPKGRSLNPTGTGMGLAIVGRIIESWGGRCWIAESNDGGTTFCLTLPKPVAQISDHTSTTLHHANVTVAA